jgi:fido (protein-threonine AMPylation protein)
MNKTEQELKFWRLSGTESERLSANILDIDSYTSIDPQCPLWWPDSKKDILCERNWWKYLWAVYFPNGEVEYKKIERKIKEDLQGVKKNDVSGIIFLTNQTISPWNRSKILKIWEIENIKVIIYHVEKIRVLLDSPRWYGLRLSFLWIEMTKEEQASYFDEQKWYFRKLLSENSEYIIKSIVKKIDKQANSHKVNYWIIEDLCISTQSAINNFEDTIISNKKLLNLPKINIFTSEINLELLCFLHKIILFETQCVWTWKLRDCKVWIWWNSLENAVFIPPSSAKVESLIRNLLNDWKKIYIELEKSGNVNLKLEKITKFHSDFLYIHPFLDGNGRLARFLLSQQVSELLNKSGEIILEDKISYFNSLTIAQEWNIDPLKAILSQAIFGIDEL